MLMSVTEYGRCIQERYPLSWSYPVVRRAAHLLADEGRRRRAIHDRLAIS